MPFMTLYLTTAMGYTIAEAGWVMAFFGLGAVCGGLLGGKLSDNLDFTLFSSLLYWVVE